MPGWLDKWTKLGVSFTLKFGGPKDSPREGKRKDDECEVCGIVLAKHGKALHLFKCLLD